MTVKNQKIIIQILAIMFVLTMIAFIRSSYRCGQLQTDLERQTENVANISYDIEYSKLNDSIPVAKTNALLLKCDELQKLRLSDLETIKGLKLKLKDVQSIHTASSTTADTVYLTPESNTSPDTPDSVYTYRDKWLSLRVDIPHRECQYASHDSLETIVSRIYRHRFLWWRWGTKGYQVQIVNHNPHARIDYSRYIEVLK